MYLKIKNRPLTIVLIMLIGTLFLGTVTSCGTEDNKDAKSVSEKPVEELDPMENKGIGPVSHVELTTSINPEMVAQGKSIFEAKCAACHQVENRYVGPAVKGLTLRRTPEWIMNMILNPVEMTQKDPIANGLLREYMVQMTFQDVSEEEARAMLEYFRQIDSETANN